MRVSLLVVALLSTTTSAEAQRRGYFDDFVGWSPDHTFFVMTTAGTDGMAIPVLCLSKRGVRSPSWPKNVPVPDDDPDGCTERWDEMFPDDATEAEALVAKLAKLTTSDKTGARGTAGEALVVRRASGEVIEISVSRKGRRIARGFLQLRDAGAAIPNERHAHWRSDGGAVAVTLAYKADPQELGFGPPSFIVVLPLDGSTANAPAPTSKRQQAQALNVAGMKALTTKQLDAAQKQFEAATELDDSFMLAYYNLACAASLRKDRAASLAALRHLSSSDDRDAKKYLAKGLGDHDLDFIAQDPEGAKLLRRKPPKK